MQPGRNPLLQLNDLAAQQKRLKNRLDQAISDVLAHGNFINGPEIQTLEEQLASFAGVRHAIVCGSGTDALLLVLMAWGIGPGDAVFVPSFTFVATAEVVALVKATPVFVDVDDNSFNLDPLSLKEAVGYAREQGLVPRAVIPVDLFGQPANYAEIHRIAEEYSLSVLADAAQSFGGASSGRKVGALSEVTATSFFPSKPLGCYGDGGAILTSNDDLAKELVSLRSHGSGADKYDNIKIGLNSRLDSLQAAILIEKLSILEEEIKTRNEIAARYSLKLEEKVRVPLVDNEFTSAWAQYTVCLSNRDTIQSAL